jgi:hypothetical protein
MGAADLCVIVGTSTTGMEALAFGKPLLEVRFPERIFSFAEQGLAEAVGSFDEVSQKIEAVLERGLSEERLARIEEYLKGLFAYRDDRTPERIARMVGEMMQARTRGSLPAIQNDHEPRFDCSFIVPVDDSAAEDVCSTLQSISEDPSAKRYEVIIVDRSSNGETRDRSGGWAAT